ncbi:MAG: glutamyl-tRNA reductase [Peptoniphilaceae bacterium]|nr:glutamyl-tRNA reductase [Peptoniphilaceae bacterium]MDY6019293.1 glutamyl-tRNA reductase [Anaerococcus sp.]
MKFLVFGINHNMCPIDLREKLHFTESKTIEACDILLSSKASEAIILSTCNRSEIYLIASDDFKKNEAVDFYEKFFKIDNLSNRVFLLEEKDAINHLLNLALGRESLIVGEDQILGQIKDALDQSQGLHFSKKYLNYIFREAISFAKRIKTESGVSATPISTAYIALKDIDQKFGIKDKKALVVGIGKMGSLSITYLIDYGADISVSNRNMENSLKLKEKYPFIKLVDFKKIGDFIDDFDLIISATKSPHTIIKKEFFKENTSEKYVLDLSLPRDVDQDVENIKNVHLYNIDKLQKISDANLNLRKEKLALYDEDIQNKACEIYRQIKEVDFSSLLNVVNDKCEEVKDFTLSYLDRKLNLSHGQRIKVEKIIKSALNKVSRDQILKIKSSTMDNSKKQELTSFLEEVYKQ